MKKRQQRKHLVDGQVKVSCKDGQQRKIEVEPSGLCLKRKSGEGICLSQDGQVLAYIEFEGSTRVRVLAEDSIEVGRSLPSESPGHAA